MTSIRFMLLIALALGLSACGERKKTAEELRCSDSGTAVTMAKALIQQRMPDRTLYFAGPRISKIGEPENCKFKIGGGIWAGGDAGGYRDFSVTVQYRGKNYWAIDNLQIGKN